MDATELSQYSAQHNPWHAAMYNGATAQSPAAGGFVVVNMDTVEFDPSNMCTLGAAAKITIQQDGVYLICGAVTLNSVPDGQRASVAIYVNAAELVRGLDYTVGAVAAQTTYSVWTTIYLKTTQFVDLRVQNITNAQAVHPAINSIYLAVAYLGVA